MTLPIVHLLNENTGIDHIERTVALFPGTSLCGSVPPTPWSPGWRPVGRARGRACLWVQSFGTTNWQVRPHLSDDVPVGSIPCRSCARSYAAGGR